MKKRLDDNKPLQPHNRELALDTIDKHGLSSTVQICQNENVNNEIPTLPSKLKH